MRVDDGHGGSVPTTVFTQQRGQVHLPRARIRQQVLGRLDGGVTLHQVAGHGQAVLHLLQAFQYVSVRHKVRRRFRHRERVVRSQTEDVFQTALKTNLNDALETKHGPLACLHTNSKDGKMVEKLTEFALIGYSPLKRFSQRQNDYLPCYTYAYLNSIFFCHEKGTNTPSLKVWTLNCVCLFVF